MFSFVLSVLSVRFLRRGQLQKDTGAAGGHKQGMHDGGRAGGQKKSSMFQLEVLTEKLAKV